MLNKALPIIFLMAGSFIGGRLYNQKSCIERINEEFDQHASINKLCQKEIDYQQEVVEAIRVKVQ